MLKRSVKGQISTEYLVIVGIALAFVIPLTIVYIQYTDKGSDEILLSKVDSMTDDISMAINTVYAYGEDSETTVLMKIPKGVQEVSFSGNEVVFKVRLSKGVETDIVKVIGGNMATCIIDGSSIGTHKLNIKKIYDYSLGGEIITIMVDGKNC